MGVMERMVEKIIQKGNPGRDFDIMLHKGKILCHARDSVGCREYQLKGTYNYNKVMELNALTGGCTGFGYCKELGPVAFIGNNNPACVQKDGYFRHEVQAFGEKINDEEYYFKQYSDNDAKNISNYTVFGFKELKELNGVAPFEKIHYFDDWRFKSRYKTSSGNITGNVLSMAVKLRGTYSFEEAKKIAFGSTREPEGYSGEDVPIKFALVEEKYPVGIMNLWVGRDDMLFKDVWGPNEEEPKLERLRFLDDYGARNVRNYVLYYFLPTHSYGNRAVNVEKMDRTMYGGYDFVMPDGTDYRLQKCS